MDPVRSRMITTTTIGSEEDRYPILESIWDFFSEKATKTVFVSIGSASTCLPDLDFAEMIGCPILKLDTPSEAKKWLEVKDILKTRKVPESASDFAKPAMKKWVLAKNLVVKECFPSYANGTIEINGSLCQMQSWTSLLKEYCNSIGISEENPHVDIVKIEASENISMFLNSLWHCGFRPSLLLIHWPESPNTDLACLIPAAHLQMLGYALVGKEQNKFLYYYTDVNYYETCEWDIVSNKCENPLMKNLIESIFPVSQKTGVQFPLQK